ncbi:MAG TPA: hypothetical protein VG937_18340 [Polyangiaceae bacterium]|jgi:hypothetical protein|nr:hypothetical protein [Polyangiaceae bacterium]
MKAIRAVVASCALCTVCLGAAPGKTQWLNASGPLGARITALDAAPDSLFAGTDGAGLFVSTNLLSWLPLNIGLTNRHISGVARSAHLDNHLAVGTLGGGVFSSWDNGATWWSSSWGLTNTTVRAMASIADSYTGTVYFVGTDSGVFRANALPWAWRAVNTGLTQRAIRAFCFFFEGGDENDGIGANDLLAGTNGGGVFHSDDGVSWWAKNEGLSNPFVTALAASSSYAVTFAGTAGGGVFRSTTAWGGWTAINDGLSNLSVTALTTAGSTVFAGTAGAGVFVAQNDGFSPWDQANDGLTDLTINALATDGTYLFAATGSGVFRRALSEL